MKILYISHLSKNIAAGMNWSVPASVKAQEQIDEVLWINIADVLMPHWKDTKAYRNLKDLGDDLKLSTLPPAFAKPDVVVFEGLYFKEYLKFAKELRKKKIPYIIVPRSSMTKQAMHNHSWLKKWIAHKLYFNKFIKGAWRIQYLTQQEADDSTKLFKTPYFIVPNGFNTPEVKKESFCTKGIQAIFIGRLYIYQKGIDILLDVVSEVHKELKEAGFFLNIYGPHRHDYEKIKNEIEKKNISDIASVNDEISGKEKENAILGSDIFIMTSRFEGHPMGMIEALAYGLPCLVTPGTNMVDVIKEYDAGWICNVDKQSIKEELLVAISEKEKYKEKSSNAINLAKQYDWEKIAKEFHKKVCELESTVSNEIRNNNSL